VVVAALAYAGLASFTRPFTVGADTVVALPLAVAVVALMIRSRSSRIRAADRAGRPAQRSPGSVAWAVLAAVAIGWELFCFTSDPRSAHPTLSSLMDMADATRWGQVLLFAAWMALGWYLVVS
jgi:hypothetical protein